MQHGLKWKCLLYVLLAWGASAAAYAHEDPEPALPFTAALPAGAEIRLGMSAALSGPAAELGTELRQGAQIYLNKVNRQGGINGRKLRLISYDDGYEPQSTITNTRKLIEDDTAFLLFGYTGTPTSRVAVPIAAHEGIPFVAPFTGAGFLRQPVVPVVFNVRAGYADETEAMVAYLTDKLNIRNIGLLIQDDAYGSAGRNGVTTALKKRGLKLAAVGKYTRNTSDIQSALTTLQAASPQAVIMVGAYAPCAAFIRQARQNGFNPVFMNISFVGTSPFIKALGNAGEGVYITQVLPSPQQTSSTLVQSFVADAATYAAATKTTPTDIQNYGALEGYVGARALARMLAATGPTLSRQRFISASEAMGDFSIDDFPLHFGPSSHEGSRQVYLTRVHNGQAVPVPLQ